VLRIASIFLNQFVPHAFLFVSVNVFLVFFEQFEHEFVALTQDSVFLFLDGYVSV